MLDQFRVLKAALRFAGPFGTAELAREAGVPEAAVERTYEAWPAFFEAVGFEDPETGQWRLTPGAHAGIRGALQWTAAGRASAGPASDTLVTDAGGGEALGLRAAEEVLYSVIPKAPESAPALLEVAAEHLRLAAAEVRVAGASRPDLAARLDAAQHAHATIRSRVGATGASTDTG